MTGKIFVTGVAGMIGSSIARSLVGAGHQVIGVDNLWRGRLANLGDLLAAPNFQFRHADIIADDDWHVDLDGDATIIHTADIVAGIGYVFSHEWSVFQKNLLINTAIARLVNRVRPERLIYLGTACSYPQQLQRSRQTSVLSEAVKFPAHPESGYGWSKLMGEIEFGLAVKGSPTRLITLDLHNVYGWPCVYRDATAQVIPSLIMKALRSRDGTLSVWGDGNQGRAFLHVDDVVSAVRAALTYGGAHDNFMIGPDHCTSIREVAELIRDHPALSVREIVFDTSKPVGDIGRFADSTLARAELGWQQSVSFGDGLYDLIERVRADDAALGGS